jgi:hypothetical protein
MAAELGKLADLQERDSISAEELRRRQAKVCASRGARAQTAGRAITSRCDRATAPTGRRRCLHAYHGQDGVGIWTLTTGF